MFSEHNAQATNLGNEKQLNDLTIPSTLQAIKTQFRFKFRAHYGMFTTMIIMQLIAVLFSLAESSVGSGMNHIHIHSDGYAGNIIIFLSIAWATIMGFRLTLQHAKDMMYTFVTDHKTNQIANILLIVILSIIGGVSAYGLAFIFKISMYLWKGTDILLYIEKPTASLLVIGMMGTILYMLLLASVAYFLGEVIRLHKVLVYIVPAVILGLFIVAANYEQIKWISQIVPFFIFEKNFLLFAVKTILTSAVALFLATLIGRRMEVRNP